MKNTDQMLLEKAYQAVLNGLAKGKSLEDIAKKHDCKISKLQDELDKGIKVEMEHTNNKAIAREIAMDHIYENPKYYTRLSTVE